MDPRPQSLQTIQNPETALESKQLSPHIQEIEGNTQGHDHILSDLHGSLSEFKVALAEVNFEKGDRVIIAGDLTDKGPDSFALVQHILALNKQYGKTVIHVVRGNHEQILLDYYDAKEGEEFERAKELSDTNQQEWAHTLHHAARDEVINYFRQLPYIIRVKPTNHTSGFIVLHADLPFSQKELLKRCREKKFMLEKTEQKDNEIGHTIWARETDDTRYGGIAFGKKTVDLTDDIIYCGHSPFGGPRLQGFHLNMDMAVFLTGVTLKINHSTLTAELLPKDFAPQTFVDRVFKAEYDIGLFLLFFMQLKTLEKALRDVEKAMEEKDSADAALLHKQFAALHKIKDAADRCAAQDNVDFAGLTAVIHKVFTENAALFDTSPQTKELLLAFSAASFTTKDGVTYHITSSFSSGWKIQQGVISPFTLEDLSEQELFLVLKNFLTRIDKEKWPRLLEFKYALINIKKAEDFVKYCSNEIEPELLIKYLFNCSISVTVKNDWQFLFDEDDFFVLSKDGKIAEPPVMSENEAFLLLHDLFVKTDRANWSKLKKIWQNVIDNHDKLIQFLSMKRLMVVPLFQHFMTEVPSLQPADFQKFAELFSVTPRHHHAKLMATFENRMGVLSRENKIIFFKKTLSCIIKNYPDGEFKNKLNNIFEALSNTKTKRLPALEKICFQFISILNTKYSEKLRLKKIYRLFADEYCKIRMSSFGSGSRLGHALQKILKAEFSIELPMKLNRPITTLSFFPLRKREEAIIEIARLCAQTPQENKALAGQDVVAGAIQTVFNLKQKKSRFGFFSADKVVQKQIDKLVSGLAEQHVHLPSCLPSKLEYLSVESVRQNAMMIELTQPARGRQNGR